MESATCCGMESDRRSVWNHGNAVYVINPKARGEYTLKRDAILRGAQITYTPKGRDYIPILRIG